MYAVCMLDRACISGVASWSYKLTRNKKLSYFSITLLSKYVHMKLFSNIYLFSLFRQESVSFMVNIGNILHLPT